MSSTIEFQKTCEHCGAVFTARKRSTRYCSKRCSEHAYKQRKREEHVASTQCSIDHQSTNDDGRDCVFLSPAKCAKLLGVSVRTIYRYLSDNQIPCIQFKGKTRIRRADIEALFDNASDYIKKEKKAPEPITEFYTSKEVMAKFGIGNSWLYKMAEKHNIPKTISRGKTLWSKKHIDRIFGKPAEEVDRNVWYTVDDMCDKYNMNKDAVYRLVSDLKITKQKVRNVVYYLRQEIDTAMGVNPELEAEYYSRAEAMGRYKMTRDQISYYVRTYAVPRIYRDGRVYIERKGLDKVLASPKIG